jgi:dedicator of cytokinesis protein 3
VNIKLFHGDNVDDVVLSHPTVLHAVPRTNRVGFNDVPFQSRSDIFINVTKAINTAAVLKSSAGPGYVTVSAEVRLSDRPDTVVEKCIFRGTGTEDGGSSFESYAVGNVNDLLWDEKFKLCISEDVAPRALLVFKFATVRPSSLAEGAETELPMALAALNLFNNGFFVRDGEQRMKIRRIEPGASVEQQLTIYLAEDTTASAISDSTLCVETFLCSTRFTEDNTLHSLLHWKQDIGTLATEESRFKMKEILRKFTFVSEIEVLKVTVLNTSLTIVPARGFRCVVRGFGRGGLQKRVRRFCISRNGLHPRHGS